MGEMQLYIAAALVVCATMLGAQTNTDAEVARAEAAIEKLKALVEAGAAPRVQLEKAEESLADAHDAALLRKTLYGPDLNESESEEMIAAAERRLSRRQQAHENAQRLVKEGVASQHTLTTFVEEIGRSRSEYDLAVSRAKLVRELAAMAEAEQDLQQSLAQAPSEAGAVAERFDGGGVFSFTVFRSVEQAFENRFEKPLPVSARGSTALHRALGFDHRDRVDVAIHPDQPEGIWLRQFLTRNGIPFFAFRQAVRGKATGAHIHIGPMSTRLANGG
jgi:hypothetical protein